jgi:hypothetical protein
LYLRYKVDTISAESNRFRGFLACDRSCIKRHKTEIQTANGYEQHRFHKTICIFKLKIFYEDLDTAYKRILFWLSPKGNVLIAPAFPEGMPMAKAGVKKRMICRALAQLKNYTDCFW